MNLPETLTDRNAAASLADSKECVICCSDANQSCASCRVDLCPDHIFEIDGHPSSLCVKCHDQVNPTRPTAPRFHMGRLFITPAAKEVLEGENLREYLFQHAHGNWGECSPHDWHANHAAIDEGSRLFSVYMNRRETKFWIITESDRRMTTILLPSDY